MNNYNLKEYCKAVTGFDQVLYRSIVGTKPWHTARHTIGDYVVPEGAMADIFSRDVIPEDAEIYIGDKAALIHVNGMIYSAAVFGNADIATYTRYILQDFLRNWPKPMLIDNRDEVLFSFVSDGIGKGVITTVLAIENEVDYND